jgi:YVTN family beta-propeller protein
MLIVPSFAYIASAVAVMSLTLVSAPSAHSQAANAATLALETKIPLGNVGGRIDHLAIDLLHRRLFVAELGNNSVAIIDVETKTVVHRIVGLREPQGVAYVASTDSLYVANGGDGSVRIFRGHDYTPAGKIDLGSDADNIRFAAEEQRLIVGYGNGALAVIDPMTAKITASYALKAHPESFQIGPKRIFVNLPAAGAITALDRATGKELASWPMRYRANFAMALDDPKQRLLTVFRAPAKLVVLSYDGGVPEAVADVCGDCDDVFVDAKRQRIYVSCGDGFIDVFDAKGKSPRRVAHIPSATGARTALFVPELDQFFLAVRARTGQPAAIWVYRPGP